MSKIIIYGYLGHTGCIEVLYCANNVLSRNMPNEVKQWLYIRNICCFMDRNIGNEKKKEKEKER